MKTMTNPTTSVEMSEMQWAGYYEVTVFENAPAALDELHNDETMEESERRRKFETALISLVAAAAARDGFSDDDIVAITATLVVRRSQPA